MSLQKSPSGSLHLAFNEGFTDESFKSLVIFHI